MSTATMTKERPILMSAPMVRATLREVNPKTQTRRIMKLPGHACVEPEDIADDPAYYVECGHCPYGKPGNRLWVRETWSPNTHRDRAYYRADAEGNAVRVGESSTVTVDRWHPSIHMPRWASRITLEITGVRVERLQGIDHDDAEAEGIEAESEPTVAGDFHVFYRDYCAKAGAEFPWFRDSRQSYRSLWESINGPGSWDANPWVWVVEFKRVEK